MQYIFSHQKYKTWYIYIIDTYLSNKNMRCKIADTYFFAQNILDFIFPLVKIVIWEQQQVYK